MPSRGGLRILGRFLGFLLRPRHNSSSAAQRSAKWQSLCQLLRFLWLVVTVPLLVVVYVGTTLDSAVRHVAEVGHVVLAPLRFLARLLTPPDPSTPEGEESQAPPPQTSNGVVYRERDRLREAQLQR